MKSTDLILNSIKESIDELTTDEILRALIDDSGSIIEFMSCLDVIMRESGLEIEVYKDDADDDYIRVYPVS